MTDEDYKIIRYTLTAILLGAIWWQAPISVALFATLVTMRFYSEGTL